MEKMTVAQARKVESVGRDVLLQGWVRTRRDSKAGFSFIELNDGSSFGNVQVLAETALPNYATEILHLNTGASVSVEGAVQASPAKGQPTEVRATKVTVHARSLNLRGAKSKARPPLAEESERGHLSSAVRR